MYHHEYLYRRMMPCSPEIRNLSFLYTLGVQRAAHLADSWDCDPDGLAWEPEHNRAKDLFVQHFIEMSTFA